MYFDKVSSVENSFLNKKWSWLHHNRMMTIPKMDLGAPGGVCCFGSCFAEELKIILGRVPDFDVFPDYSKMAINSNIIIDELRDGRNHLNQYSPLSIQQEIDRVINNKEYNFIPIKNYKIVSGKRVRSNGDVIWQDPYRREIYSNSIESLKALTENINRAALDGLQKSNIYLITLGLVEVFILDGCAINRFPGYMGDGGYSSDRLKFMRLSSSQVEDSLVQIVSLIKGINPQAKLIFTVSPIPLLRTFSDDDVYMANSYSKSTLRSAVERVRSAVNNVHYFPSYEIALNVGSEFFVEDDMRHAKRGFVQLIMTEFMRNFDIDLSRYYINK